MLQLVAQLQRFRKLPGGHPISDVRGMAAVIAHRTCSRWMRRQFPERHALKNRLHYLLTRQRGFALWQNDDGKQVGGLCRRGSNSRSTSSTRNLQTLNDCPTTFARSKATSRRSWPTPSLQFSITPVVQLSSTNW